MNVKLDEKMRFIGEDDEVYSIEVFKECVQERYFTDYDGCLVYATDTKKHGNTFSPSEFMIWTPPTWATHIVWYNK